MRDLNSYDVDFAVRRLNRLQGVIEQFVKPRSEGGEGKTVIVAGGFIRSVITGEEIQDIDVFVGEAADGMRLADEILRAWKVPQLERGTWLWSTENAITIRKTKPVIQIITRWTFGHIDDALESFDFTIAAAGIEFRPHLGWRGRCHREFYEHLAARRLFYTKPEREEEAGGSTLRLLKFVARGYRSPIITTAEVLGRLLSKVEAGAIGNEEKMINVIMGLLFEVDPQEPRGRLTEGETNAETPDSDATSQEDQGEEGDPE